VGFLAPRRRSFWPSTRKTSPKELEQQNLPGPPGSIPIGKEDAAQRGSSCDGTAGPAGSGHVRQLDLRSRKAESGGGVSGQTGWSVRSLAAHFGPFGERNSATFDDRPHSAKRKEHDHYDGPQ